MFLANKSEIEKRKELARLIRRRHESFMLHPSNDAAGSIAACLPKNKNTGINEEDSDEDLEDIDKRNNNYLAQNSKGDDSFRESTEPSTPTKRRVKTKSTSDECEIEGSGDKRVLSAEVTPSRAHLDSYRIRSISDIRKDFQLGDIIDFVHKGMEVS